MKYLVLLLLLIIPARAYALTESPLFEFGEIPNEVGIGEEFPLDLYVNTNGETINGVELDLKISSELELVEISESKSVIPLWIERPKLVDSEIKLAGIIPGGFIQVLVPGVESSSKGKILSLILRSKSSGVGRISLENQIITLHDGSGTLINVTDSSAKILISNVHRANNLTSTDVTSPDVFFPELVRDPNVFSGDLVLYFETRDYESGIARYEVREDDGPFVEAISPYRLRGRNNIGIIAVRAIDRAGNDRTVELHTGLKQTKIILWPFVLILVAILVILLFVKKRKRSQHR